MSIITAAIDYFLNKTETIDRVVKFWDKQVFDGNYGHTVKWCSTSNKDNSKYTNERISYYHNESGYRIAQPTSLNKLDSKNSIACFGCSQTYGVGLTYEETWPYIMQQQLEYKYDVRNYGVRAASADTIARLISCYLINNKPEIICCMLPDMFRRELFETDTNGYPKNYSSLSGYPNGVFNNISGTDNITFLPLPPTININAQDWKALNKDKMNYHDWRAYSRLSGEDNSLFNFIKNVKFIEMACKANNVELFITTWDIHVLTNIRNKKLNFNSFKGHNDEHFSKIFDNIITNWDSLQKARDNLHFGVTINNAYASFFSNNIINR